MAALNCAKALVDYAVTAVDPYVLTKTALSFSASEGTLTVSGRSYSVNRNVRLVAFGKAVIGMVKASAEILCEHVITGLASIPAGTLSTLGVSHPEYLPDPQSKIKFFEGALGNIPDSDSLKATVEIMKEVSAAKEDDIVLVLISGGGSALLWSPVDGISADDKLQAVSVMSNAGATIQELNKLRSALSSVKCGQLAEAAYPAKVVALVLADVIGSPLSLIASGPTFVDVNAEELATEVLQIVDKYQLAGKVSSAVLQQLRRACIKDKRNVDVTNVLIGDNSIAVSQSAEKARAIGLESYVWSCAIEGEAKNVGKAFAILTFHVLLCKAGLEPVPAMMSIVSEELPHLSLEWDLMCTKLPTLSFPLCIIGGGETTVAVRGSGKGGRNQEVVVSYCLTLKQLMSNHPSSAIWEHNDVLQLNKVAFASFATDGQDGPTDAAGACVTAEQALRWKSSDMKAALDNNDSYSFLQSQHDCLLKTGLTGTNVMDLYFLVLHLS